MSYQNQMWAPQAIPMQAPQAIPAGVAPRFVALLIDHGLVGIIGGVLIYQVGFAVTVSSVVAILNFIVLEGTQGATLGKMLLGLRVVKVNGSPIGLLEALIRNVLRAIDALPIGYLLGGLLALSSPLKQRLGDRLAQTVVIKHR